MRVDLQSSVTVDGLTPDEFYGPGARKHPSTLTRTERPRFIRSYYNLWGLMRLDCSKWDSRLEAMTSQELYYLWEMTKLTQSIGREEIVPPPFNTHAHPDSYHSINWGQSEKRRALEQRAWQQIERNSWRFFERGAQDPSVYAKHEGSCGTFIVLWDHWQSSLQEIVYH